MRTGLDRQSLTISEYNKLYYELNREKIIQRLKERIAKYGQISYYKKKTTPRQYKPRQPKPKKFISKPLKKLNFD